MSELNDKYNMLNYCVVVIGISLLWLEMVLFLSTSYLDVYSTFSERYIDVRWMLKQRCTLTKTMLTQDVFRSRSNILWTLWTSDGH